MDINDVVKNCLQAELVCYRHINFHYTTEGAPSTGKAIYEAWLASTLEGISFPIFSGANDPDKLYFTPEVNLLYRTLHDIHHAEAYMLGWGTTKISDEKRLNCKMAYTLYARALKAYNLEIALEVFFKVYHDTVGQVLYYQQARGFCVNQKELTLEYINECQGLRALAKGQIKVALAVMQGYMSFCDFSA